MKKYSSKKGRNINANGKAVLLRFNKRDSQIARNWSKTGLERDVFDDQEQAKV